MQMHKHWLQKTWSKTRWLSILLVVLLSVGLGSCGDRANFPSFSSSSSASRSQPIRIKEVAPPELIRDLRRDLDSYQPQVQILSPRPDEVLQTQTATVRFSVQDLPLFKDETFGLGTHLHVFVDDQPYQAIYDPATPLVLDDLTPGTHTIRAFASRPWHESFKNEGAFTQSTFHVFTKTADAAPKPEAPLLTYSRPQGSYGAEPIMLDFYLTQAPLHAIAQADTEDDILDWKIRCTINGESFEIDEWRPLYLKGFKPGQNWVQLELLDEHGEAIDNAFNNTVRLIDYAPNGQDALSQLVRNEIPIVEARRIVIPGYEPPAPEPEVIPVVEEPSVEPTTAEPTAETLDETASEPTEATESDSLESSGEESTQLEITPDVGTEPEEVPNSLDQVEEFAPEGLPVELVAPSDTTELESALEQEIEEIQEQAVPAEGDTALSPTAPLEKPSMVNTAVRNAEDSSEAIRKDRSNSANDMGTRPNDTISVASTPLEAVVNAPESVSPSAREEPSGVSTTPEAPAAKARPTPELSAQTSVRSPQTPSLSEETESTEEAIASRSPISTQLNVDVPKVKPSPALNSYEAKAILEELEDLETKVEDLKGTIASAADSTPVTEEPSSQIEELRSQLDQLKDSFGNTWQRLSDFVRMKLQG